MKKPILLVTALVLTTVLAQGASDKRVVNISGKPTGNVRTGPLTFKGNPVKATVSTLKIESKQAKLVAPKGGTINGSKGKRTSTFTDSVVVKRGRLTAKGGQLEYSEATGKGILTKDAKAVFVPKTKKDGDPVNITAGQMSLDVDTNVSTSTGKVKLVSGNQTGNAEKLIFNEDKELAQFTGTPKLVRKAEGKEKELIITGKDIRALTKEKTLYVKGGVKVVQGDLTTTGDAVYYDDKKNVAYIVGNAVSVNSKSKVKVSAPAKGYLEQNTKLARVSAKNSAYKIPAAKFNMGK